MDNYPNNSTAFYLMGCIFEKKGDIKGGIEFFSMAIDIDPNNVYSGGVIPHQTRLILL